MENFEKTSYGFVLGVVFMLIFILMFVSTQQDKIVDCQKQHNVYRCEIVAVPVKGE